MESVVGLETVRKFDQYELYNSKTKRGNPLFRKRTVIGSSDTCDIRLNEPGVSSIHAVLEVEHDDIRIYDMNSKNGTYLNDSSIVASSLKVGDCLKIGLATLVFKDFSKEDIPVPPLNILKERPVRKNNLVKTPAVVKTPEVVYPLSSDPNADFSEYIFEDQDEIYPIFKYEIDKQSVEVVLLFNDKILSVDYLPGKDGSYYLKGFTKDEKEIELPYLGVQDKVEFIKIKGDDVFIERPYGLEFKEIKDKKNSHRSNALLGPDDIFYFYNEQIQIFVRRTDPPPKVLPAPILRRDKEFKKYLLLVLILVSLFTIGINLFEVDEELEKEKAPERIATILYRKKIKRPAVTKSIAKTKNEDKKKVQKSPKQRKVKDAVKQAQKKKDNKNKKIVNNVGKANAKKVGKVKKGTPKTNNTPKKTQSTKQVAKKNRGGSRKDNRSSKGRVKGRVDTYKSVDFTSSVSNLLSKTGGKSFSRKSGTIRGALGSGEGVESVGGVGVKRAKISGHKGSLRGDAKGVLDSSKGSDGIVDKKSIYTAGLPDKVFYRGGMDPDTIRKILEDHVPQFRHCYESELDRRQSKFHGVVSLNFIIGASGHVTKAGLNTYTKIPSEVTGCIINVLKGIKFPRPRGKVEVNQPMNFYPNM